MLWYLYIAITVQTIWLMCAYLYKAFLVIQKMHILQAESLQFLYDQ